MSTHDIYFYEEIWKLIPKLSPDTHLPVLGKLLNDHQTESGKMIKLLREISEHFYQTGQTVLLVSERLICFTVLQRLGRKSQAQNQEHNPRRRQVVNQGRSPRQQRMGM